MCEYIGIRLTGYDKKLLITEILKITVQLSVNRLRFHSSNSNAVLKTNILQNESGSRDLKGHSRNYSEISRMRY